MIRTYEFSFRGEPVKVHLETNGDFTEEQYAKSLETLIRKLNKTNMETGTIQNTGDDALKPFFNSALKLLTDATVFPSEELTIRVEDDPIYGGAHFYSAKKSTGFKDGKAEYVDDTCFIQFVKKNDDGSIVPGVQSEQLALIILDRAKKLNARFPSVFNDKMILGLNMFIEACKERVEDRINRGVMGDLKK